MVLCYTTLENRLVSLKVEAPITLSARIRQTDAEPVQPRARGSVVLGVKADGAHSRIEGLRQSGSLKCLFPRRDVAGIEAVLVNTSGGITGGDRFSVEAKAGSGTALTLTTQAAERAYRAQPGETGGLATRIEVAESARVNWLPQETILFDGAALERSLTVELAPGASALICEPLVFGRLAMGEQVKAARFHDRIDIRRDGKPLYLDAMRLSGDIAAQLDRPHTAAGARAMASLILVAPDAEARLEKVRAMLPPTGGASLIQNDVLALRLLAPDSHVLRQSLIPILTLLTQEDLPRCWMI
jgi:urease accessory protein